MPRDKEKYTAAFKAAVERTLKAAWVPLSPADLERRCAWVLAVPERGRRLRLRHSNGLPHPHLVGTLVAKSFELRLASPKESLRVARAAVDVSEALGPAPACDELASDLRAQAWGNLANSLRLTGDLRCAEDTWALAYEVAASGSGDPLLRAELASKRANLLRDLGHYDQAAASQINAATLFEKCGALHSAGKNQLELGITLLYAGEPKKALEAGERAARLLDMETEPEMALALYHNTLFFLEADGEHEMAFIVSGRIRWWYEVMESPLLQARYQWLRGRLALAAGVTQTAARCADEARQTLLAEGQLFDAALAGFDACLALLKNGSFLPAQRLATEMYTVFTSKELPREAHAALLLFADAARAGHVTVALAEKVAGELAPVRKPGFKPTPAR